MHFYPSATRSYREPAGARRGRATLTAAASAVPIVALAFAMLDGAFMVAAGALMSLLGVR